MKMTNNEIYSRAIQLNEAFNDGNQRKIKILYCN